MITSKVLAFWDLLESLNEAKLRAVKLKEAGSPCNAALLEVMLAEVDAELASTLDAVARVVRMLLNFNISEETAFMTLELMKAEKEER